MHTANSGNCIRVWAISFLYYPNFSGAAIQAHRILRELARQGFCVTVLTSSERDARHLRGREIERDGVTIKYLAAMPLREWKSLAKFPLLHKAVAYFTLLLVRFSTGILCAWRLWRDGKRHDIVQFYDFDEFSLIPVWLARAKGMHPVIQANLLGSDDPGAHIKRMRRGNILAGLTLGALPSSEAVIGLSTALTDSCRAAKLNPDRIWHIPNGVDLQTFRPVSSDERVSLRETLGLRVDRRYVIFVGSAVYRKGIDVLVRTFIRVTQGIDDADLLIVGQCDFGNALYLRTNQQLVDGLKTEIKSAGLESRVHWVGMVDNVHEYLQAADVFCFPTRREGLPNAVGEAMGVGLGIVLSSVEGVTTDFLQSGDEGILVREYDPDDYAHALLQLLKDPAMAKAMGNAARARVVSEFSLEHIVERYAQLYRELASASFSGQVTAQACLTPRPPLLTAEHKPSGEGELTSPPSPEMGGFVSGEGGWGGEAEQSRGWAD